jgi:hypothetical protein
VANSIENIEKALDRIDAWTKKISKELRKAGIDSNWKDSCILLS